jgi:hypothetical protein
MTHNTNKSCVMKNKKNQVLKVENCIFNAINYTKISITNLTLFEGQYVDTGIIYFNFENVSSVELKDLQIKNN